nr:hypothetical protein [uncultured Gimesia sp.]
MNGKEVKAAGFVIEGRKKRDHAGRCIDGVGASAIGDFIGNRITLGVCCLQDTDF